MSTMHAAGVLAGAPSRLGLGGSVVVLGSLFLGLNPLEVLSVLSGGGGGTASYVETGPPPKGLSS